MPKLFSILLLSMVMASGPGKVTAADGPAGDPAAMAVAGAMVEIMGGSVERPSPELFAVPEGRDSPSTLGFEC